MAAVEGVRIGEDGEWKRIERKSSISVSVPSANREVCHGFSWY